MVDYLGEFNEIVQAQKDRARQQDIDDLNAELGGYDNGRTKRFLSAETRDAIRGEGRKGKGHHQLSTLEMLLLNPEYSRIYVETQNRLQELAQAAETALEKAEQAAARDRAAYEHGLERAYVLDDGRHVFRDERGIVWDEHDHRINDDVAAQIEWKGHELTREEFLELRDPMRASDKTVLDIREYQTEIGDMQNQMKDPDFSADDLMKIQEKLAEPMPEAIQHELPQIAEQPGNTMAVELPKFD
ncbi:hypothetical protein [Roseibium sp.]|uniref:hypothetical protein n=1 Tax=Roseibium sp. TaxID=1936156 RepID=UPI003A9720E0